MANPMLLQLIDKKDVIGKPLKEVLPELESQGFIKILDSVYSSGETFTANEALVKLNKNNDTQVDRYLNFTYQPHRNNEGEVDGIYFFTVDVIEQVEAQKKLKQPGKGIKNSFKIFR